MAMPTGYRNIRLIDGRTSDRAYIEAIVYRDFPAGELVIIENEWTHARSDAALTTEAKGLAPLEHSHWDWRNKAESVEDGRHMLVAVTCCIKADKGSFLHEQVQGLMAVARLPRVSSQTGKHVVYVDYIESAPWNLKGSATRPRYVGVGTALMVEAIRISHEAGLGGRIGLHSLPQAEAFYSRCGLTRIGTDIDYYDLGYFEYSEQGATAWLASIGESL